VSFFTVLLRIANFKMPYDLVEGWETWLSW